MVYALTMNEQSIQILTYLWPLIVIQFGVQIYAIVDLFRKKKTKILSVPIWIVIILLGNLLGAIAYLIAGRAEDVESD